MSSLSSATAISSFPQPRTQNPRKLRRRSHALRKLSKALSTENMDADLLKKPVLDSRLHLPTPWYFYNLKQSIDEPHKPFNEAALASPSPAKEPAGADESIKPESTGPEAVPPPPTALYSQTTLRRTISPVTDWISFNPGDARRIFESSKSNPSAPVAVGHERMLFEVVNECSLRPIYWSIPYYAKVTKCHWVFSTTLTPIDPTWDTLIEERFSKFLEKVGEYSEILEGVKNRDDESPQRMKSEFMHRLELTQAGKPLSVDLLFSPICNKVYLFKADSSYTCARSTAEALLSGNIPRGVLCVLQPFEFNEYKRMYSLPDRPSDDESYEPLPVNNLILVFHGIGQKLSDQYSKINFVYAIDKLRVEVQRAMESPDVFKNFPEGRKESVRSLVLAVNWRSVFNLNTKVDFSPIIVPSLGPLRQAFSDAMLDIPLYMSENRRPDMLAAAASEANRLYRLVLQNNPSFESEGRTHIIGHSLGSLITADLLTHQPSMLKEENFATAPFKFTVDNYFTTGSMLGVFMMLKGEHLRPRTAYDKIHGGGDMAGEASNRPFGCFAARNLYNIIDQSDLLSFLANATVEGALDGPVQKLVGSTGKSLEADTLPSVPSVASGLFSSASQCAPEDSGGPEDASIEDMAKQPRSEASRSRSSSSLSRFLSSQIFNFNKPISNENRDSIHSESEAKTSEQSMDIVPEEVRIVKERLELLNENGQIDWMIPQTIGYIPSHYLKMITAHFDYWSNKDLARFLAIECGRKIGVKHTLAEHRAKWVYKE